jgi:NAD(P)H-hydrate repair Nnr-like enzyme with NAD(P)H-hydrate epimerase domain
MGVRVGTADESDSVGGPDLILDGLIGCSPDGAPRGATAILIGWANDSDASVLSLDAPFRVDTTTGTVFDPAIRATAR